MSEQYYWVEMQKGDTFTKGYVEERAAKLGAQVELVADDNELWTVTRVSERPTPKELVRQHERAYKEFQGSTRGGGIDQ